MWPTGGPTCTPEASVPSGQGACMGYHACVCYRMCVMEHVCVALGRCRCHGACVCAAQGVDTVQGTCVQHGKTVLGAEDPPPLSSRAPHTPSLLGLPVCVPAVSFLPWGLPGPPAQLHWTGRSAKGLPATSGWVAGPDACCTSEETRGKVPVAHLKGIAESIT